MPSDLHRCISLLRGMITSIFFQEKVNFLKDYLTTSYQKTSTLLHFSNSDLFYLSSINLSIIYLYHIYSIFIISFYLSVSSLFLLSHPSLILSAPSPLSPSSAAAHLYSFLLIHHWQHGWTSGHNSSVTLLWPASASLPPSFCCVSPTNPFLWITPTIFLLSSYVRAPECGIGIHSLVVWVWQPMSSDLSWVLSTATLSQALDQHPFLPWFSQLPS